jgi:HK97 gp10 family phage protein
VPDSLTITVEMDALFAALDALGVSAEEAVKSAAKVTAEKIKTEAQARVARRTGATARGITVEETHAGKGYVVYVGDGRQHIASFLEFGTRFMTTRPFLFASALLEEGAHTRRVFEALQGAIDDAGWK